MSLLDPENLSERTREVEKHLHRMREKLPYDIEAFIPGTDASDVVILHLWHAIQIVTDIALSACLRLHLSTPSTYSDAFRRLSEGGYIDKELASRLAHAAQIKNQIAHAHHHKSAIFKIAQTIPHDLKNFLTNVNSWFSVQP